MAKGMMGGGACKCPHHKAFGWVILILGVLFLLRDFNVWSFWNISWWTAAFILIGLGGFCKCCDRGVC
jgi:predicted ferric reductase